MELETKDIITPLEILKFKLSAKYKFLIKILNYFLINCIILKESINISSCYPVVYLGFGKGGRSW